MIDIETIVFDEVYPYVAPLVPEGSFASEFNPQPAKLPHVCLTELDNTPDVRTADSGNREWSAILMYQADAYASTKAGCRELAEAIDEGMIGHLGFRKLSGSFTLNTEDVRIFRYTARYTRGVDQRGNLYRPQ